MPSTTDHREKRARGWHRRLTASSAAACLLVALAPGYSSASESDGPEISVDSLPASLDFYATSGDGQTTVYPRSDGGDHIAISNEGSDVLEWSLETSSTDCDDPTDVPWVTTVDESGSVPADGSTGENFLDWHGTSDVELELGTHEVLFCISSNDPESPMVEVPLSVTVVEPQDLPIELFYMSPDDQEQPNSVAEGEMIAYQAHAERLNGRLYAVQEEADWSSSDETVATVNDVGEVTGVAEGQATITVDYEGWEDSVTVYVHAEGAAPDMAVSPESLEFELPQGDREDLGLTISNAGDLHLNWQISSSTTGCAEDTDESVEWIWNSTAGSLEPGASREFSNMNNQVRTSSLEPGEYEASLCVGGDDPDTPMVEVPVALTVTEDDG